MLCYFLIAKIGVWVSFILSLVFEKWEGELLSFCDRIMNGCSVFNVLSLEQVRDFELKKLIICPFAYSIWQTLTIFAAPIIRVFFPL